MAVSSAAAVVRTWPVPEPSSPPPPSPPPSPPSLCGAPALSFCTRYNLSFATASHQATWTVLLFILATLVRTPRGELALQAVGVCYAAGVAAELAWRRRCHQSYLLCRQLAFPLFVCGDVLLARAGVVKVGYELVTPRTGLQLALMLVLASRWLTNVPIWLLGHPLLHMLPAQLVIVYNHWRVNDQTCASGVMATPQAQAVIHRMASALDRLQFGGLMLPSVGQPATPAHECRTVLAFQQLFLSLAAPALIAAVVETRMWRQHEEERQCNGLPPEGGLQCRLYRALDAWLLQSEWPDFGPMGWLHLALLAWLLASTLHAVAALLAQ